MIAHSAACRRPSKHSKSMQGRYQRLDSRLDGVEVALTGAMSHHALVRYDAYNELSGQQSMSIALLDDRRSGIVLTCIHHRDQARVYAKQVRDGVGELELSPEEAESVQVALAEKQPRSVGRGIWEPRRRIARMSHSASALPRAGYLGPEGTFSEEALLGSVLTSAVSRSRWRRSATP